MTLYFHNDTDPLPQEFVNVIINSDCSRINFFHHDRNGIPAINNQLADTTQGKTQLFIQNMAGLSSKIWFSNLESWKDSMPLVISKAELVVPIETSLIDIYSAPSRLLLVKKTMMEIMFLFRITMLETITLMDTVTARVKVIILIWPFICRKLFQEKEYKKDYTLFLCFCYRCKQGCLKGTNFIKLNVTYTKIK